MWQTVSTKLVQWYRHPVARHVALGVLMIGLAAGVAWSAERLAGRWTADVWRELVPPVRKVLCDTPPANPAEQAAAIEGLLPGLKDYKASDPEKQRIANQAAKAQRLECLHLGLVERYVTNYYIAVLVSLVFGGITAVALFLVGPKGWSASNQYLVTILVMAGAIAAFYGAFPSIFQQSAMTAAHKTQILRYEALLDGMASHVASPTVVPLACIGPPPPEQKRIRSDFPATEFIACTDSALAAADVPFALDPSKAPDYQKFFGTQAK